MNNNVSKKCSIKLTAQFLNHLTLQHALIISSELEIRGKNGSVLMNLTIGVNLIQYAQVKPQKETLMTQLSRTRSKSLHSVRDKLIRKHQKSPLITLPNLNKKRKTVTRRLQHILEILNLAPRSKMVINVQMKWKLRKSRKKSNN